MVLNYNFTAHKDFQDGKLFWILLQIVTGIQGNGQVFFVFWIAPWSILWREPICPSDSLIKEPTSMMPFSASSCLENLPLLFCWWTKPALINSVEIQTLLWEVSDFCWNWNCVLLLWKTHCNSSQVAMTGTTVWISGDTSRPFSSLDSEWNLSWEPRFVWSTFWPSHVTECYQNPISVQTLRQVAADEGKRKGRIKWVDWQSLFRFLIPQTFVMECVSLSFLKVSWCGVPVKSTKFSFSDVPVQHSKQKLRVEIILRTMCNEGLCWPCFFSAGVICTVENIPLFQEKAMLSAEKITVSVDNVHQGGGRVWIKCFPEFCFKTKTRSDVYPVSVFRCSSPRGTSRGSTSSTASCQICSITSPRTASTTTSTTP